MKREAEGFLGFAMAGAVVFSVEDMSTLESVAIVNMEELAELVGKSGPTLRTLIRAHDGFPVVSRGKNGVAYEFDAHAVAAWLADRQRAAEEAETQRRAELRQLRLELFGPVAVEDDATANLTPHERKAEADAQRSLHVLGVAMGRYVPVADMRRSLDAMVARLRQSLLQMPDRIVREFDFDRATKMRLRSLVDEAMTGAVAAIVELEGTDDRNVAA